MTETLITFFASFLIWFMFAGLSLAWLFDGRIKKAQIVHALISTLAAWLFTQSIKVFFPTLRPFEENGLATLTLTIPSDSSFPSAHTAAAFSLAVSLFLHNKKLGSVYLASAFLVGGARVLANVHYPADILAGALIGSIVALTTERLHVYKFFGINGVDI